jgi:TrkA-N domain/Ion channel
MVSYWFFIFSVMERKKVLILGIGHLSHRVEKLLVNNGYTTVHQSMEALAGQSGAANFLDNLQACVAAADIASLAMIYLLDEKDEHNLQALIAIVSLCPEVPVTASLFNENLVPHLQAVNPGLTLLNPAKISAPVFVEAIYRPMPDVSIQSTMAGKRPNHARMLTKKDWLLRRLLFAFASMVLAAVIFFHAYEKMAWIDALYFVVVTVATVGYGDINLVNSGVVSKLFAIVLILASTVFIWMIFSLTIDRLIKKRIQLALGRKKYHFNNHIVVCGLGRLGYFIVEDLLRRKEKVIVIEQNEDSRHIDYFRQLGAEVYIGDGRLPKVMADVNVARAKALVSVINNDVMNLEIGLNARTHQPGMRLVLRIFDEQMADKINDYFAIRLTLSTSAIADEKFYAALKKGN